MSENGRSGRVEKMPGAVDADALEEFNRTLDRFCGDPSILQKQMEEGVKTALSCFW